MGAPLALLFGILGNERVTPFPLNFLFRGVMSIIRSVPSLVWALIYVPLGGISPVTATLAIGDGHHRRTGSTTHRRTRGDRRRAHRRDREYRRRRAAGDHVRDENPDRSSVHRLAMFILENNVRPRSVSGSSVPAGWA
jgi:hypothetical protein